MGSSQITSLGEFPYSLTIVWLCLVVYLLLSCRKIQLRFNFKVFSDARKFVLNISWYMNSSFHHVNLLHTLWWKHYHIVIRASQLGRPSLALIVLFSSSKLTMWIEASYLYFSLTRPNTITSVGTWLTSIFLSNLQTRRQVCLRANQERTACRCGLLLTAWCITFASNVQKTSANILRLVLVFFY